MGNINLLSIHVGSVVASQISQSAVRRIHFDEKMQTGKIIVLQPKMGTPGSAHQKYVMLWENELLTAMGTFHDCETNDHFFFLAWGKGTALELEIISQPSIVRHGSGAASFHGMEMPALLDSGASASIGASFSRLSKEGLPCAWHF